MQKPLVIFLLLQCLTTMLHQGLLEDRKFNLSVLLMSKAKIMKLGWPLQVRVALNKLLSLH